MTCPVFKTIREGNQHLALDLKEEARRCDMLVLWLDCDREGENIAFEVIAVCASVNPRLRVLRAQFSAVSSSAVQAALANLRPPDRNASDAVDARQEIDFRIGTAFTRWQTLVLLDNLPHIKAEGEVTMLSYGPCQFPTLGFVADRYDAIAAFVPEDFWSIEVTLPPPGPGDSPTLFTWQRGRLYDHLAATVLAEMCVEAPTATVQSVIAKPTSKFKPYPLATVELQKRASRWLGMSSDRCMKVAEALYQRGILSYPRTETERFPEDFDFQKHLRQHRSHPVWGAYAAGLLDTPGTFDLPRKGAQDDQAHPPIHPLKSVPRSALKSDEEWRLYDYVTRHFLAACSKDAKGHSTTVYIDVAGEAFKATGLVVMQRNYLEVFTFERWKGKQLPAFAVGQTFQPLSINLQDGHTTPPSLLSEPELIGLMDEEGIGTDATIAEHIATVLGRKYIAKTEQDKFLPTTLGMALLKAYEALRLPMGKPYLRAAMERDCAQVCSGAKRREDVVRDCIREMREVFDRVQRSAGPMLSTLREYLPAQAGEEQAVAPAALQPKPLPVPILACGSSTCTGTLRLRTTKNGTFLIGCSRYPACKHTVWLPREAEAVEPVSVEEEPGCVDCAARGGQAVRLCITLRDTPPQVLCLGCGTVPPPLQGKVRDTDPAGSASAITRGLPLLRSSGVPPGVNNFGMGAEALLRPGLRSSAAAAGAATQGTASAGVAEGGRGGRFLDEAEAAAHRPPGRRRGRQRSASGPTTTSAGSGAPPLCKGHATPCVQRTARSGANEGRPFWCCAKQQADGGCGFNGWLLEPDEGVHGSDGPSAPPPQPDPVPSVSQRTVRKCGICRQPGHTRSRCPQATR